MFKLRRKRLTSVFLPPGLFASKIYQNSIAHFYGQCGTPSLPRIQEILNNQVKINIVRSL